MHPHPPVFDCHVHIYPDPLAAKAVEQLSRRFGNPPAFDGTVSGMVADLAESGISGALNLPVATRPEHVDSINAWAAAINVGDGPVRSLATIHPDIPDIPAALASRLQDAALLAHRALRLGGYSRIDFIADANGEVYCLEANSLPGLTPASLVPKAAAAIGMGYDDLCDAIVRWAVRHG
jgi:hypothetical protein